MMIAKENNNNDIYKFLQRYNDKFHHSNNYPDKQLKDNFALETSL